MEDIQDHHEDAVDHDDEDDGGDHRRGGGEPDGLGAPPRPHAPETADECDQDTLLLIPMKKLVRPMAPRVCPSGVVAPTGHARTYMIQVRDFIAR